MSSHGIPKRKVIFKKNVNFGDSLKYSRMLHSPYLLKNATKCQWTLCHFGRRIATTWLTRLVACETEDLHVASSRRYECPTVSQPKKKTSNLQLTTKNTMKKKAVNF